MQNDGKTETKKEQNHPAYLLIAMTLLLGVRILPALKAPLSSYGYDFGFYSYAASHANFNLADFGQVFWGGYNSFIFLIGNIIYLPPQVTLVGSYFSAAVFLGICLYLLMKNFAKSAGIFAVLLLACSQFQAEAYNMFLWKNILALPFLVLGFKFLMEKNWRPFTQTPSVIPHNSGTRINSLITFLSRLGPGKVLGFILSSLTVLLLHRTTAIIYFLTIAIYFIWLMMKSKRYQALTITSLACFLTLASIYYGFNLKSIILNLTNNPNSNVTSGLFLENQNLIALWWPAAILAVLGVVFYIKKGQNPLLLIFASVCLFWIIFKLPFSHRILIYLDLAAICFGAYFLYSILSWQGEDAAKRQQRSKQRNWIIFTIIIIFLFLFYRAAQFIWAKQPLISPNEISELKNFNQPPGFVLATTADDAPWLLAYVQNQRLGAPGLLEDPQTFEQWQDFWQGKNQRQFLSHYPRPLYFYQRGWRLPQFGISRCLTALSENFSQLDYGCLEKTLP